MEKIAEMMTAAVPQIVRHRESRKNALKRSFVQATDAVAAKYNKTDLAKNMQNHNVKKQKLNEPETVQKKQHSVQISLKQRQNQIVNQDIDMGGINATKILDSDEEQEMKEQSGWNDDERNLWNNAATNNHPLIKFTETQKAENFRNLLRHVVLFENDDENDTNFTINKTTAIMRKVGKVEMKYDNDARQYIHLFNDQIIGQGSGDNKKLAKKSADEDFVQTLK